MSKLTTKVLVGLGGTGVALLACATPAFAAGSFVSPTSNPFTANPNAAGNPLPQDVVTTGYAQGVNVNMEVCDGKSPSDPTFDATIDCDNGTAPAIVQSQGTSYDENFTAANGKRAVPLFRGESPSDSFNCLATEDTTGAKPSAAFGGNAVPIGAQTKNGDPIDTSLPSWTNCQLRVSSNNAVPSTTDQAFISFNLPNTVSTGPTPSTPEVPLAIILPIGAAGLFGAGFAINRRRRSHAAA